MKSPVRIHSKKTEKQIVKCHMYYKIIIQVKPSTARECGRFGDKLLLRIVC